MSPLYTKLQELGGLWTNLSSSKLKNILLLSCCILKTRSCNLQTCRDEVASVTGETNLKEATAYARLKRVFQTGVIAPVQKALFLMVLHLVQPSAGSLLIMDRTDFAVGSYWGNLLVMGLRWHGVFIPLIWKDLGQRGNSSQQDRIDLLDRMLAWWKASGLDLPVLCVVGDREFIGQDWFWALEQRKLQYVIRIKSNLEFQVLFNGDLKHHPFRQKCWLDIWLGQAFNKWKWLSRVPRLPTWSDWNRKTQKIKKILCSSLPIWSTGKELSLFSTTLVH